MRALVKGSVFASLFCAVTAFAADTRAPAARESVDHVAFPDVAVDERRIDAKLPIVQDLLGSRPEDIRIVDGKWTSIDGTLDPSTKFRALMDEYKLGTRETEFFSNRPIMQSRAIAIGLKHGRVARVVLITGDKYTYEEANKQLRQFRLPQGNAEEGPTRGAYGALQVGDVTYYASGVGKWKNDIPAKFKTVIDQFGNQQRKLVSPARTESGPVAFVFEVNERDWWMLQFCRKEFFKDVKAGKPKEGMTEMEARIALIAHPVRIETSGQTKTLRWYKTKVKIDSVRFAKDGADDLTTEVEVSADSVLFCTAVVTNDVVTSVTWSD